MNDSYNDASIRKWYIEVVRSFTIHAAGWASANKRMSNPDNDNHECIFDLVSYKDEAFVMLDDPNIYEGWNLRVQQVGNKSHKIHHTYVGRWTQNTKKKRNTGGM